MRTTSAVRLPLVLVLSAVLAAGCAGPAGDPAAPSTGAGPTVPAPAPAAAGEAPAPSTGPVAPAVQPDDRPSPPLRVVATGLVKTGAEPGCLLLDSDLGRTWLLVGGDRAVLAAGARVRVIGERLPGRPGSCQQGAPLRVVAASLAG